MFRAGSLRCPSFDLLAFGALAASTSYVVFDAANTPDIETTSAVDAYTPSPTLTSISPQHINSLNTNGNCIIPNFLPRNVVNVARRSAIARYENASSAQSFGKQNDSTVRTDSVSLVDESECPPSLLPVLFPLRSVAHLLNQDKKYVASERAVKTKSEATSLLLPSSLRSSLVAQLITNSLRQQQVQHDLPSPPRSPLPSARRLRWRRISLQGPQGQPATRAQPGGRWADRVAEE